MTADIIAAIDEITAPQCGWCNKPLRADGPSDYFCNEQHQMAWRDGTAAPRPSWIGRALGEPVRILARHQPVVSCRDQAEVFTRPVGGGEWVSLGYVPTGALDWLPGGEP